MIVRFVHAADLHLDATLAGLAAAEPAIADAVARSTFTAWERIVDLCIERRVDALLIAGDVYNRADRSLRAQLRFAEGLERLDRAGIQAVFCHGNHDPLDGWQASVDLPSSATRFSDEPSSIWLDTYRRVSVTGISYRQAVVTDNLAARLQRPAHAEFAIGLLHSNIGGNTEHGNYAPATLDHLRTSGFDYWALGHVHTRQIMHRRQPVVAYPGNPQGLHINEPGSRGVYLVEVDDSGHAHLEFIPCGPIVWQRLDVAIDDLTSMQELVSAVENAAGEAAGSRDLVYRLKITGRGPLHRELAQPGVVADLRGVLNETFGQGRPFAWCERLDDTTRPETSQFAGAGSDDLAGVVQRMVEEARNDREAFETLRSELESFYLHRSVRPYRDRLWLDDDELLTLIEQAGILLQDLLEEPA